MGPMFDPTEDYLNIVAAEERMGVVEKKREGQFDKVNGEMKGIMNVLVVLCKIMQ